MNDLSTQLAAQSLPVAASTAVEQSRAVAETQAAMIVAQKFPRDENASYLKIMTACKRTTLAASGSYAFKRGGQVVTGPSIRLAEVMARCWGNIDYGFRELNRTHEGSEVESYCWDMEYNVRVTRTFFVKHWRDTKGGGYALKDERDKYELIASQAQRRVRACILEMIPGDIVEAAENECKKTLAGGDVPLEDRVRKMLAAFKDIGVTQDMIEGFLDHKITAIVPVQIVRLTQIYTSIKDGVAAREDFFTVSSNKTEGLKKAKKKELTDLDKIMAENPEGYALAVKRLGHDPKSDDDVDKILVFIDEAQAA